MTALGLAWRTIARSPARSVLAVSGVTVIGALLFDMLLLSRGLLVSFRDLLDTAGFDIRVVAAEGSMVHRPPIARRLVAGGHHRAPARRAASHAHPDRQRRGDPSRSARPGRAGLAPRHDGQRRRRRFNARQRSAAAVDRIAPRAAAHRQHQNGVRTRPRTWLDIEDPAVCRRRRVGTSAGDGTGRRDRRVCLRSAGRIDVATTLEGFAAAHGMAADGSAEMVLVSSAWRHRCDSVRDREAEARPARAVERSGPRAIQSERVQLLSPDFRRAVVDDARVRVPPHRHAVDDVGESAARRGRRAARARFSAAADRGEPVVGVGAARRHRRHRARCRSAASSLSCSTASCARCPASRRRCISSCSSPDGRAACGAAGVTGAFAALYPIWLATRLPIAATLRREILS